MNTNNPIDNNTYENKECKIDGNNIDTDVQNALKVNTIGGSDNTDDEDNLFDFNSKDGSINIACDHIAPPYESGAITHDIDLHKYDSEMEV